MPHKQLKERRKSGKEFQKLLNKQIKLEKDSNLHKLEDTARFDEMKEMFENVADKKTLNDFIEKMQPIIQTFEENEIGKVYVNKKNKTIYFYAKEVLTIGTLGTLLWKLFIYRP